MEYENKTKEELIEELKRLQKIIDEEEKLKLSSMVEQTGDVVVITDKNGIIQYVNPAFEMHTGYKKEEVIGKTPRILKSGKHSKEFYKELWETILSGKVFRSTFIDKKKNGELFYVEETITPIKDASGNIIQFSSLWKDITKIKQMEEELTKSKKLLENAISELKSTQQQIIQQERLRALGQMASGIAHDFNNTLTPILGFSEVLLTVPGILDDKEKVKKYLQIINTSSQDAANIVSRLREFYRKREETEVLQPIILKQLVEQVIELTKPKWGDQAQAKDINIKIKTELREVPLIYGIETELREVLINIIFNAVDAIEKDGTITIRTYQKEEYSVIEVSDTGIGMSEEVKNRIFEPFFTTKKDTGTGLGLSMVYGVIQRYQGKIEVKSEINKGTTFIIYLPITEKIPPEEKKIEDAISRRLNILLVDDRQDVREAIAEYLKIDGNVVSEAKDGQDGLEKFKKEKFDLVITDKAMPKLSGDQLAKIIKEISPHTPLIMISGFSDMMEARDDIPENVDLILSKPITLKKLREGIKKVITK